MLNEKTGEILSRHAYAKIKHAGLSSHQLAKLNAVTDKAAQIARPARGRSSIQKLAPEYKKTVAELRIEAEQKKKEKAAKAKKADKAHKKIEQLLGKQIVKVPKFSGRLLKPGNKARRVPFNDYEEYVTLRNDAKKSGLVFSYFVGIEGIDTRSEKADPKLISITVFPGTHIGSVIDEETFNDEIQTVLEDKASYFLLLHYWIHFSFTEAYYTKKAKDAGIYKNAQGRTITPAKKGKKRK